MSAELSSLQQQVADLWSRFKAPAPRHVDDGTVARLSAQVAALEGKRKELVAKRSTLRLELQRQRREAAGRLPVWRALGALVGLGGGVALVHLVLPYVTRPLPAALGAGLVALGCLLAGLALRRSG